MTETRVPRSHSPARLLEQALLLVALVSLVFALVVGFVPVTNPGVQACGSPFVFSWHTSNDVVLPPPGSPSAPPNDLQLLAQEPCHQRVDSRLILSGLAVVITVVAGLSGALIGLFDDRSRYRAAPPFEAYLRERPAEAPSDPWDQPVIPVQDLGERLPDIEWGEVRVVVWVGVLAVVALAWLGPWSEVRQAFGHLRLGWVLLAVLLVASTYPLAAGGIVAATDGPGGRRRPFGPVLAVSIASSFTGRLLPEYGPSGLAVHQLVRAGQDRRSALDRLTALDSVSPVVHAALLVLVGLVVIGADQVSGAPLRWQWVVWLLLLVGVVAGLVDAPRRYATLVVRPNRRSLSELAHMGDDPVRLAGMVGSALALALVNALVVLVAARAVGAAPAAAPVLFLGLVVPVVVVVAPTPDGAGMVEAALVLGFIWAGLGAGAAVAAMVLVRFLTFWIPMLPGWFALRGLRERGEL